MENEIHHIESRHGALIWAIGCVWAAYVERYWRRTKSAAFSTTYVITLLIVLPFSLAFWMWYLVYFGNFGLATGAKLGPTRVALGLSVLVLAGVAAPGQWQWRTIAGSLFPFLAFVGFLATARIGLQASLFITSMAWPHGWVWFCIKEGIAGIAFGVTTAAVLSLPFSLMYRLRAVLLATLALLPEIAQWTSSAFDREAVAHAHHNGIFSFLGFVWPWVCTVIAIALCARLCNRWLPRWPERSDDTALR
jgi:hypothetical protein